MGRYDALHGDEDEIDDELWANRDAYDENEIYENNEE